VSKCRSIFIVTIGLVAALAVGTAYAAPARITFLHYLSAETMDMLQPLINQFSAENNVTVDIITVSSADVVTKLQVMAATGVMPDVMRLGSEFINLIPMDPFMVLHPFVERDRVAITDFFPPVYESFVLGKKLLALPTEIATYAMYYNVDKFDETGLAYPSHEWGSTKWNWDVLMQTSAKLSNSPSSTPRRYGIAGFGGVAQWLWWWNADWIDPETRKSLADTPASIAALQKITDAYLVNNVAGGSFDNGTAAMVYNGNWANPTYAKSLRFNWDVAPQAMGTQARTILFPNGLFMSSSTTNSDAAWRFIKFMTTQTESAKLWSTALGRTPAMRRIAPHYIELQNKLKAGVDYQVFINSLNYAQYPNTRRVPEALQVEQIITDTWPRIRNGSMSVAAGAAEITAKLNALLSNR